MVIHGNTACFLIFSRSVNVSSPVGKFDSMFHQWGGGTATFMVMGAVYVILDQIVNSLVYFCDPSMDWQAEGWVWGGGEWQLCGRQVGGCSGERPHTTCSDPGQPGGSGLNWQSLCWVQTQRLLCPCLSPA